MFYHTPFQSSQRILPPKGKVRNPSGSKLDEDHDHGRGSWLKSEEKRRLQNFKQGLQHYPEDAQSFENFFHQENRMK